MNLYRKRLDVAFLIGLLCTLFIPPLFPSVQLLFFAPFLIILFYKKNYIYSLWGSLLCGVILDVLSSEPRLGLHAINYMLATTIIYRFRHNFFPDSVMTLPILTFIFSLVSIMLEIVIMIIFNHPLSLHGHWIFNNVLLMPILEACFTFFIFVLPALLFGKKQLRGSDYFAR